jgi:hypothetical protein
MTNQKDPAKKERGSLSGLAGEHKLFSGFAGSALVALIAVIALVAQSHGGSTSTSRAERGAAQSEAKSESTTAASQIADDADGDGVPNAEDECSEKPGGKPNGCPVAIGGLALSDIIKKSDEAFFEGGEREYLETENAETGQVTVGGVTDPLGVSMEIPGPEEAGAFTIETNNAFKGIEGRVGITTEPCSGGSVAYVAVRNGEGEPLWPADGGLRQVGRTAIRFKVSIGSQSAVVLYAQAPEPPQSCDEYVGRTMVGWVHTRLSAAR